MKKIYLPLKDTDIENLRAGESVLLSGRLLTGRDCAHKRICEFLDEGKELPFSLRGETVYYAGPCPAPEGKACGSCGPDLRSGEVTEAIVRNKAVYFAAVGGAGALYGNAIVKSEIVAFPDLLSEAVYRFEIRDFPLVVAIDSRGESVYKK